jgi:dTDP-4-amino-4,6-dideoxygalactose transaminase
MSKRKIPFFDYPALFARQKKELMPIIEEVLSRGAYIMQKDLFDFEDHLAEYLGIKHVIGVGDGTMAIILALRSANIGEGDEVLVPSHTFVASAAAVHHVGAKPVLVDCGSDHLISSKDLVHRITSRTKAIMPVQLNGRTANMEGIEKIAIEYDLQIIEDSCQALGSKFKGRFAGTFGIAGTCSFYPSKTLGCFGDGGAVLTNDDEVAESVRLLRDHGRASNGDIVDWGYNTRLDNIQAAVLDFKLSRYDSEISRRREIASRYNEKLKGIHGLLLPPGPDADTDHFDIYQNYELESSQRDALRSHLQASGVQTILQWGGKGIHQFQKLNLNIDLPKTQELTENFFMLPMNTSLSDADIDYICEETQRFHE